MGLRAGRGTPFESRKTRCRGKAKATTVGRNQTPLGSGTGAHLGSVPHGGDVCAGLVGDTLGTQDRAEGLGRGVGMTEAQAEMAAQWSQSIPVAGTRQPPRRGHWTGLPLEGGDLGPGVSFRLRCGRRRLHVCHLRPEGGRAAGLCPPPTARTVFRWKPLLESRASEPPPAALSP